MHKHSTVILPALAGSVLPLGCAGAEASIGPQFWGLGSLIAVAAAAVAWGTAKAWRGTRKAHHQELRVHAFRRAPDAMLLLDARGRIHDFNDEAERLLGVSPEALAGRAFTELLADDEASRQDEAPLSKAPDGDAAEGCERLLRRPGGESFRARVHSRRIDDRHRVVTLRDVTSVAAAADRTQAEEALRESELRYRTLAETSGVGIWQVTPDGATIYANPAMCAFLGCDTMEEVQRRSYDSFFTRESLRRMRREHIRRSQGIASSYEVEVERADGETRTAVAYGAPIQNPDGTLHSRIGTFVDVTERKKAEEALQESDLRFRQLTENINEVFWLMDAETRRIIYLSPAVERIWGITAEQNLRRPGLWLDYVHPGDRDRVRRLTRGLPNHDFADEFRIVRSDGTIRWLRNRAFPVRNPEGVVFRFAGIVEDITERKEFETHLQHSQKLESLGILAGGIAHDFNNLLLGILGNADLALMEIGPVSPGRRYLEDAVKICQRAADLCNQMLAYSGRGKFVIETVDIGLLVREMSHLLEVSVSKKAVLKYNFADNLSPMEGDATQIRQVIMNLITNASDALGTSSGVITVSTGSLHCDHLYLRETYLVDKLPEGEYVYFEVSDNGAGMSRETRTRIFDPFFTTKFTGRGLGLAAVLGIVRSHKGAIKVYSEVGHGSTFKVLFPVSNHEYDRQRSPERAEALPAGRGTILLVDDEEAIRIVGQKTLEKAGYTVVTASNGAEAIEVVRALGETIEAVVLDMTMPKMGGEEAFREMRRIRPGIRVLLSSGYSEGDATQRFSGKGLAGFLQKPYRPHALIQSLSNILAQHE